MIKRIDKKDLNFYLIVAGFFVLFYIICTNFGEYLFGSTIDWNCQHYKIPEYFRQLFYETGDLFPNFAPNLGAGQNIYNFSYYGFLNPVILLSYLLPFVPMHIYIAISTLILVYASVILMYKWLSGKVSRRIAVFSSVIFLLSSPLLFHTHRHVMFVNYMPFLMMGLIGVDKYFKQGNKILLPISVFFICMTSYYYSIGSIVALMLYGIYAYIENNSSVKFKAFLVDGTKFVLLLMVGILMAAILLLPTFAALLSGRGDGAADIPLPSLFMPTSSFTALFYDEYGLGLTSIALFALIYGVVQFKRERRFLSIFLLLFITFPVFCYLLNAGMYVRSKALIPLLPLYVFALAESVNDIQEKKTINKTAIIIFSLVGVYCTFTNLHKKILLFDFALTLLSVVLFNVRKKGKKILFISAIIISLVTFFIANTGDTFMPSVAIELESRSDDLIEAAIKNDEDYYRINDRSGDINISNRVISANHYVTSVYSSLSNQRYQNFFYNAIGNNVITRSRGQLQNPENLLFDIYTGNKYIITESPDKLGLRIIAENKGLFLCETINVLPVAHMTFETMSAEQYKSLEYPYNIEALTNCIIVDEADWCDYESTISEINLKHRIVEQKDVSIECHQDGEFLIYSKEGGHILLELDEKISGQLLFISFDIEQTNRESVGDHQIAINNIANTLPYKGWTYNNMNYSFEYVLSESTIQQLNISFSAGTHKISNIKVYAADYDSFVAETDSVTPFEFNKEKTKGDVIEGNILAEQDGYFTISIPYDRGFAVYVDGEKVDYELVNTAFIGFKLTAGEHDVRIVYHAPLKTISIIISALAFAALGYIAYTQTRKENTRKKYEKTIRNS